MNFFIFYVALPALFFRILSNTPLEQLAQLDYIAATSLATGSAFTLSYAIGLIATRGNLSAATVAAVAGGFGNVGYMGPGLALAAIGQEAAAPTPYFLRSMHCSIFTLVPLLMAVSRTGMRGLRRSVLDVVSDNPPQSAWLISAAVGVLAAAYGVQPPTAVERLSEFLYTSAAPCALFALGVTVALRPMKRVPQEVPLLAGVKLLVHPVSLFLISLGWFGPFNEDWLSTAALMAALPPALSAYVFARQYDTWIEQASGVV